MAQASVADVYWRFNPQTKQVDIIADGEILETTTLAKAADRVTFHRGKAPQIHTQAFVAASYKRRKRRSWQ